MKKLGILFVAVIAIFVVAGCEKVTKYNEGTYTGSVVDTYNNENNVATAKIEINSKGKIESVDLDTTYQGTTKKTLGDDYNMKKFNSSAAGEWYEQVEKLEKAIVENNGVSFLNLNEDGKTDAVSGCTIKIDALIKAVEAALAQAK